MCALCLTFEVGRLGLMVSCDRVGVVVVPRVRQAQIQATDALMEEQQFAVGPVDSWMTSFAEWAANMSEYR